MGEICIEKSKYCCSPLMSNFSECMRMVGSFGCVCVVCVCVCVCERRERERESTHTHTHTHTHTPLLTVCEDDEAV